ncbi:NUDIX domain-containing protein [Paracoccaceae bacterium GXU_MW_L88]
MADWDDLLPDDPALAREMRREFEELGPEEDAAKLRRGIEIRAIARLHAGGGEVGKVQSEVSTPYRHYFKVEDHKLRHQRYDGSWTGELDRAVFVAGDAVTVLPYDPVRDEVLMVEQFRLGPYARGDRNCWTIEAIAGRIDKMEAPAETARREAVEEAGLKLDDLIKIGEYYASPGGFTEYLTSYLALTDLSDAGGVHGLDHEEEDIRSILKPAEEAIAMIGTAEIRNAPLIVSLLFLARERSRLRAEAG